MREILIASVACLGFTGCSMFSGDYIKNQNTKMLYANDAQLIVNGLTLIEPVLASVPGIPAATLVKIDADISTAQSAVAALSGPITSAAQTGTEQAIEAAVNDVVTYAAGYLPPPYKNYLTAAVTLLQVIEAAVQGNAEEAEYAPNLGMSVDQARATLAH